MELSRPAVEDIVRRALAEDVGTGDVTTLATVTAGARAHARIVAKTPGVIAGLAVVEEVFRQVDADVQVSPVLRDGRRVGKGDVIAQLDGPARGILTGERVALNFLQRMSGIATITAQIVDLVNGTGARVVDTRKTTPGLRVLEKYAVSVGGGCNHRMGLYDAVLIKDNHIAAARGITAAVRRARESTPHTMTVTVECETLDEVREALAASADILLLDNMTNEARREAVRLARGRARTEASGAITEETAAEVARSGVNFLSVGALTHSAPALDISLDIVRMEFSGDN